ncbi:MAG: BMP family ABC transporter substrate-binding protein, partial [Mycoplasmataceae bacterium]|nr:BMP family ABC transporter substrate-binding protein [Mycoplasmataceae bacterium]
MLVSCKYNINTTSSYAKSDIGGLEIFNEENKNPFEEIKTVAKNIENGNNEEQKDLLYNQPIVQIISPGKVNDLSFNQLVWEGVSKFSELTNIKNSTYLVANTASNIELFSQYDRALHSGYKIWILTGFFHETPFSEWLKFGNNQSKLEQKKIKIISVDWDVQKYIKQGLGLSALFRTQESSFVIGYSISKFLAEKYSGDNNKDKRIINTSAGFDNSGATNFNYGFLEGIRTWNKEQKDNSTKIQSNVYTDKEKVWLGTTFVANNPDTRKDFEFSIKGGTNIFKGKSPTIIMPVAGDWSKTAADIIKDTNNKNKQWVIGVDTNMAISYGKEYSNYFITSSEKKIAILIVKALCFLTGITDEITKTNPNNNLKLRDDISMDLQNQEILIEDPETQKLVAENLVIEGRITDDLVGYSRSTIENPDDANKFNDILNETKKRFFEDEETSLEKNVNQELLNNFNQELSSNNADNFNKAVFELNNVYYGTMTSSNQGYFNLVLDEINKWT